MRKATKDAWAAWFSAWYAAFWTPEDLPALRQLARVYDEVEQGATQRHGELRLSMETWGMTRKGQMQNRWRPLTEPVATASPTRNPKARHLRAVKSDAVAGA